MRICDRWFLVEPGGKEYVYRLLRAIQFTIAAKTAFIRVPGERDTFVFVPTDDIHGTVIVAYTARLALRIIYLQ